MEIDRRDLKARASALYTKYGGPFFPFTDSPLANLPVSSEPCPLWTKSEQQTWRDINVMMPDERTRFDAELSAALARNSSLNLTRFRDHMQACREIVIGDASDDGPQKHMSRVSVEPSGTFEEWFW